MLIQRRPAQFPQSSANPSTECAACRPKIENMLQAHSLCVRFRPIAEMDTGEIYGHIALLRGSTEMLLYSAARIVGMARRVNLLGQLLAEYFQVAMTAFMEHKADGLLILPLPAHDGEGLDANIADLLLQAAEHSGLPVAERVIIAFNGLDGDDELVTPATRELIASLRHRGIRIATGSIGCTEVERQLWSEYPPEFMLLEDHLLDVADHEHVAAAAVLLAKASLMGEPGLQIILSNIGNASELALVRKLPIKLVAGDFIGRPHAAPSRNLSAAAHKAIANNNGHIAAQASGHRTILDKLLIHAQPVTPNTGAEFVFAMFEKDRDLRAIAVVLDGVPLGLISRYDIIDNMARPYRHELFGKKPCTRFMDDQPLMADIRLPLHELAEIVVNAHPRHLISGFIITEDNHYVGIGSVQDLVRHVTSMQMEAARYANPLTQLPGNVPISEHIDACLAAAKSCVICYCDLDHFKPFNDVYGYARGDDVIRLTAHILGEVCERDLDFLGHIGGDDFIIVFLSEDWQARCNRALRLFGEEILGYFANDDVERGGYVTENRKGLQEFHALMSLSIGAVVAQPKAFNNHLQVATVAAEVKKRAKAIPGNSLFVDQRTHPAPVLAPATQAPD